MSCFQVSMLTSTWNPTVFKLVEYYFFSQGSWVNCYILLWGNLEWHYCVTCYGIAVFHSGGPISSSINKFRIQKLVQIQKTGKESWLFIWVTALSLLISSDGCCLVTLPPERISVSKIQPLMPGAYPALVCPRAHVPPPGSYHLPGSPTSTGKPMRQS